MPRLSSEILLICYLVRGPEQLLGKSSAKQHKIMKRGNSEYSRKMLQQDNLGPLSYLRCKYLGQLGTNFVDI